MVEAHIKLINDHMQFISNASNEQSTGLAEVNAAVKQMDQVTQRNAAMVEEATAASAMLAKESSRLRELIASFKLAQRSRKRGGLLPEAWLAILFTLEILSDLGAVLRFRLPR